MKSYAIKSGERNPAHMKFGNLNDASTAQSEFDKLILSEMRKTIHLIANGAERKLVNSDGVRLGDYQTNFELKSSALGLPNPLT